MITAYVNTSTDVIMTTGYISSRAPCDSTSTHVIMTTAYVSTSARVIMPAAYISTPIHVRSPLSTSNNEPSHTSHSRSGPDQVLGGMRGAIE